MSGYFRGVKCIFPATLLSFEHWRTILQITYSLRSFFIFFPTKNVTVILARIRGDEGSYNLIVLMYLVQVYAIGVTIRELIN
jgi:hypothetical protein